MMTKDQLIDYLIEKEIPDNLTPEEESKIVGVLIGGIWIHSTYRIELKNSVNEIKQRHNVQGELKWNKISPKYKDLYCDLIDYFFSTTHIRFRVILINSEQIDNEYINASSAELGFYKFYYRLIKHWIYDGNQYSVFLDHKTNGNSSDSKKRLRSGNLAQKLKRSKVYHGLCG